MTLIKVKNRATASLKLLTELVLRFVYEPDKMRADEILLMQDSINNWVNKIRLDKSLERVNDQEEYILERIAWMLKKDANREFEARKQLFKEHKIDWRKYHNLPGARTAESIFKAQKIKEDYDKRYPEFK